MSDLTAQVLLPPTRCRHASLPEFTIEATRFCGSGARSIQDEANLQQHHPLGQVGTCSGRIEHGLADIAASTRRCVAKAAPLERVPLPPSGLDAERRAMQ